MMQSQVIRCVVAGGLALCVPPPVLPYHAGQNASTQATPQSPYILASGFPNAREPAAVAYTPALRRAIASEDTRRDGGSRTEARSESNSEFIHIVMSADTVMSETRIAPETPMAMEVVPDRDTRLVGSPRASGAVWVRHDPARRERQILGTEFHGVAIGAFRRDQLCSGCYVVLYRMNRSEDHKRLVAAWAVIPEDVAGWR